MKLFAFVMAVMVLTQSFLPCSDAYAALDSDKVKTEISKDVDHQEQSESDDCSPFCQCACCAGFSVNHFVSSVNFVPPYNKMAHSAYLPSNAIEIVLPIWQPPKLS